MFEMLMNYNPSLSLLPSCPLISSPLISSTLLSHFLPISRRRPPPPPPPHRWSKHSCSLMGGKPLWVDPFDPSVQHIFFDDNIRQNDKETIVHPMVRTVACGM